MERLKITLISLTITILTFMFGPLVLSALIYYGYTYCGDRLKKETKINSIPSLYAYAFFALPFIIFYSSKQLGFQKEIFEVLRFIFRFKIIEMYDFNLDERYFDKLVLFSISHLFSVLTVFIFSFCFTEIMIKADVELSRNNKKSMTEKEITEGGRIFGIVFFFFILFGLVAVYYFYFPSTAIVDSKLYRGGVFSVIFFPFYIFMNVVFLSVVKYKSLPSSN